MEINETCSECGAEAFSIVRNTGFGSSVKCESCGTLFKLERVKNRAEIWYYALALFVVLVSILGGFLESPPFSLFVICMWVALGFFIIVFLLSTFKTKRKLMKLV
jgi:hypothetical protein